MDYLQYSDIVYSDNKREDVLNLVINGLPSIHKIEFDLEF